MTVGRRRGTPGPGNSLWWARCAELGRPRCPRLDDPPCIQVPGTRRKFEKLCMGHILEERNHFFLLKLNKCQVKGKTSWTCV